MWIYVDFLVRYLTNSCLLASLAVFSAGVVACTNWGRQPATSEWRGVGMFWKNCRKPCSFFPINSRGAEI